MFSFLNRGRANNEYGVLGPFVHGRHQNLRTNEGIFGHVLTPLGSSGNS